jgi:hypothetical protein
MVMDEAYFHTFDMERICIDKVFFLIYDEKYVQEDHTFDRELRDRFIQHVKRSRIQKGQFEQVLRKENLYSSWELQLRGPRIMRFHVNVIHFLQQQHNIRPDNVIYDDNFMPVNVSLTLTHYIAALRQFVDDAKIFYRDMVKKYWNEDLENIRYKFSEIEIPYEIYPGSVEDIANNLYAKGLAFSKYNTQSGTIYLQDVKTDNMIKVSRKYDNISKVDDIDLEPARKRDILYVNRVNSGRNENKIQIKIYQKTFGLCRIEFTLFSLDAKGIFNFDYSDTRITDTLTMFIHHGLKENGIHPERYDRSLDDVIRFAAKAFKEPEDLIYSLKDCDVFESCQANRSVRQRLVKKGVLLKKFDSDGMQQRGVYIVNPIIRDFLNMYKAKGNEHFVKGGLYADL